MTDNIGHNNPPSALDEYKALATTHLKQLDIHLQELMGRTLNDSTIDKFETNLKSASKIVTNLEAARTSTKKPILELGREIDAEASKDKSAAESLIAPYVEKLQAYRKALHDKAVAEAEAKAEAKRKEEAALAAKLEQERLAEEERQRLAREAEAKRIADEAEAAKNTPEALAAAEAERVRAAEAERVRAAEAERQRQAELARQQEMKEARERAEAEAKKQAEQAAKGKGQRKKIVELKITNLSEVPPQFLILNEKAAKAFLQATGEDGEIPGVEAVWGLTKEII